MDSSEFVSEQLLVLEDPHVACRTESQSLSTGEIHEDSQVETEQISHAEPEIAFVIVDGATPDSVEHDGMGPCVGEVVSRIEPPGEGCCALNCGGTRSVDGEVVHVKDTLDENL